VIPLTIIMNDTLTLLSKVLPQLAVIAAVFGFAGWFLRGLGSKPTSTPAAKTPAAGEKTQQQDRAKNLEATLEKAKAAHKSLKAEFDQLKSHSVPQQDFEKSTADLEAARKALEAETRRLAALETELKKAQDSVKHLNARANEADKAQKDRSFALENELSKAREQLAVLQNRPDDSAGLQAEIERLRESVATTTRFAGELRKREAAAVEALEKAEARIAQAVETGRDVPAPSKKIGPVVESSRIAAAKAEVLRLVELNKQKEATVATESPAAAAEPVASTPEIPAPTPEPTPEPIPELAAEPTPVEIEAPAPEASKPVKSGELFALD
jgi:predicted RNase H-like nuclease (RuvC/YqgF family)